MQNKCNGCENGFVSLDGSWGNVNWSCGGCGCQNCGCDTCSNCGWSRCGCNNGCDCNSGCGCASVVRTNARQSRNSGNCDNDCQNTTYTRRRRNRSCECENESRTTECGCNSDCEDTSYTRQNRRNRSCECENESRTTECGCNNATYGSRSLYVECCDDNTYVRDMSCGCSGSNYTRENRSNDCDKCDEYSTTYTRESRNNGCDKCGKCDECGEYSTYTRRNRSNDCDECDECGEYSTATYTRESRNNGCNKCSKCDECGEYSTTYTRESRRSNGDKCDKCNKCDNDSTYTRSCKNKGVGMVWAAEQELDQIFESESALRSGTLFPELHKPMNGYCPGECNCQTDEQAAAFAAWELRLYLNTHPNDQQALALFRKLCREAEDPNYATSFLEDECCTTCWNWTDDPWPWECRPCGE